MRTLHVVYWTDAEGKAHSLQHDDLGTMLKHCEALRQGGMARFVCSATEDANVVGKPGVDIARDYGWFKRRLDPQIPLGRNTRKD